MVKKDMVYLIVVYLGRDYGGVNGFWFFDGYINFGNGEFCKKFGLMDDILNVDSFN